MDNVPETSVTRHGILRSYFRSVLAILFLLILMVIIMILPVNNTLKMSFAGSLLFLIVYAIACVVQANLTGLIMDTSNQVPTDVAHARQAERLAPRPRSPMPPARLSPRTANPTATTDQAVSPSRTSTPTRTPHRHHHHHHHRSRTPADDPPPPYEKLDFSYQPDYLPASESPFCDPPPYPATPQDEEKKLVYDSQV